VAGRTRYRLILLLGCFLMGPAVTAQETGSGYSFDFRGEAMTDVLDRIARVTDTDLAYDPVLVRELNVYHRVVNQPMPELLTPLLRPHNLDFVTLSSGTIVIVRSVQGEAARGTFAGKIVDSETDAPLPGATILLADASGGTSTGSSGNFSIPNLISGTHRVVVSYLGYQPVYRTIQINPNEQIHERIALTPKPIDISPIVVEAHQPRLPFGYNGSEMSSESQWSVPEGVHSPLQSLSLIPGVQHGLPMRDLHLQGGQQNEHRILLDGIPVYHPYSFGQLYSSFSPLAIGDVSLQKSGFGPEHGSYTAGTINLKHDRLSRDSGFGRFQGDPLTLNLRGDFPIPVTDNQQIRTVAAVRTNYWNLYQAEPLRGMLQNWDEIDPLISNRLLSAGTDAREYRPHHHHADVGILDMHVAATFDPDDFTRWEATFYGSANRIHTERAHIQTDEGGDSPGFLFAEDSHNWRNTAAQIQWNRMVTPRLDLTVRTAWSENRFEHMNRFGTSNAFPFSERAKFSDSVLEYASPGLSASTSLPTEIDGNRIRHIYMNSDAAYSFSRSLILEAGLQADHIYSDVEVSSLDSLHDDSDQSSFLLSGYVNNRHTPGQNWIFTYGSRFTWHGSNGQFYPEPRFSLQYDRPDSPAGYWSARLAGGLYRQFINEYRITSIGASSVVPTFSVWSHNAEMRPPKAWHLTGSVWLQPDQQTDIILEGYYKWHPVAHITSYNPAPNVNNINRSNVRVSAEETEMLAAGASLRIERQMYDQFKLMAGYDYSFVQVNMQRQFGRNLPAPWNDPHRAQLRAIYHASGDLSFAARWQGIWGRTWAYHPVYYNFIRFASDEHEMQFSSPDLDVLPSFHQVDLSVIYQPSAGPADLELRLDLINLLNRENSILQHFGVPDEDETGSGYAIENRTLPGFYPSVSVTARF
jgi:hypothetical protein